MTESNKLKMDDEYITQNDTVQRYLHNKLTPEETVEFEEYILDKPELLERLELDMVLVETLPHVKTQRHEQHKISLGSRSPSFWTAIFGTPLRTSIFTACACILCFSILFNSSNFDTTSPSISPNIVYLENYRSADSTTTLIFKSNEILKVIVIDTPPNSDTGDIFEISLFGVEGELVWVREVFANNNAEISFLLFGHEVVQQNYQLTVKQNGPVMDSFNINIDKNN